MNRRSLLIAIVFLVTFSIVNASVFIYRWFTGTVAVAPPEEAVGAACTGFYSIVDQPGINDWWPLPPVGSNAYSYTYDYRQINITPGRVVCILPGDEAIGRPDYYLYESIHVYIPITVGNWYIHDLYGFGYASQLRGTAVQLRLIVDQAVDPTILTYAKLIIYNARTGEYMGELDLTIQGSGLSLVLYDWDAVRLDLVFNAVSPGVTVFKVLFSVQQMT